MRVSYTSRLPGKHLEELQELMFFNAQQHRFRAAIVSSIEDYGEPVVKEEGDWLRIHTSRLGEVQTLYALEGDADASRAVGVMIYARTAPDTLTLLHIGVDPQFSADGPHADELVTHRLLQRLICVGRQIKGIRRVVVLYGREDKREIPIRR